MRSEIVLITRVRTSNQGNQALSRAWANELRRAFPGQPLRLLERCPKYLTQFSLAHLERSGDPVARFEAIAQRLCSLAPTGDCAGPTGEQEVVLDLMRRPPRYFADFRARFRLRRLLIWLGFETAGYGKRLAAFRRAALVVFNPAGEFFVGARDVALLHLLDIRVAQLLGARVAVVNLSLEATDPTLDRIVPYVFDKCDLISFRDDESPARYLAMGGRRTVLTVPDLAIVTHCPPQSPASRRAAPHVGIAIHTDHARLRNQSESWVNVLFRLKENGILPTLISNDWSTDEPFYAHLMGRTGVGVDGIGLDASDYVEFLGNFDAIITSRMHTAVLSVVAGTPFVAIEPGGFKMAGVLSKLGILEPPLSTDAPQWVDRLVPLVMQSLQMRAQIAESLKQKCAEARREIDAVLPPALKALTAI